MSQVQAQALVRSHRHCDNQIYLEPLHPLLNSHLAVPGDPGIGVEEVLTYLSRTTMRYAAIPYQVEQRLVRQVSFGPLVEVRSPNAPLEPLHEVFQLERVKAYLFDVVLADQLQQFPIGF